MQPHGVFKEDTKSCTNKDHHQSGHALQPLQVSCSLCQVVTCLLDLLAISGLVSWASWHYHCHGSAVEHEANRGVDWWGLPIDRYCMLAPQLHEYLRIVPRSHWEPK